jgi:hypothetical protein
MPHVQWTCVYELARKYYDEFRSIDRHGISRRYPMWHRDVSCCHRTSVSREAPLGRKEVLSQRCDVTLLRQTCANSMIRPHHHHVIICVIFLSGVAALPPLIKIGESVFHSPCSDCRVLCKKFVLCGSTYFQGDSFSCLIKTHADKVGLVI